MAMRLTKKGYENVRRVSDALSLLFPLDVKFLNTFQKKTLSILAHALETVTILTTDLQQISVGARQSIMLKSFFRLSTYRTENTVCLNYK